MEILRGGGGGGGRSELEKLKGWAPVSALSFIAVLEERVARCCERRGWFETMGFLLFIVPGKLNSFIFMAAVSLLYSEGIGCVEWRSRWQQGLELLLWGLAYGWL